MAIIKKPIHKIRLYLFFLLGLVLALITGIFLKTSQHNLSQLKNKAVCVFGLGGTFFSAEAKTTNCWTPVELPAPPPIDVGCAGCGCGGCCAGGGGSSGTAGCCCDGAGGGGGC